MEKAVAKLKVIRSIAANIQELCISLQKSKMQVSCCMLWAFWA